MWPIGWIQSLEGFKLTLKQLAVFFFLPSCSSIEASDFPHHVFPFKVQLLPSANRSTGQSEQSKQLSQLLCLPPG